MVTLSATVLFSLISSNGGYKVSSNLQGSQLPRNSRFLILIGVVAAAGYITRASGIVDVPAGAIGGFVTGMFAAWGATLLGGRAREKEEPQNAKFDMVSTHQTRWHIAHTRDDLSSVVLLLAYIAAILTAILFSL